MNESYWMCDKCGHEWSAMMSDADVPTCCECGGSVEEVANE